MSVIRDPEYWRKRSEATRALAEAMDDPVAKAALIKITESYERLAQRAEARELGIRPP
jgi:hypothetical protein